MSNFEIGRVAVISLWAEDVPATARFYKDVLGLELFNAHGHEHRPHFKLQGAYLTILKGRPHPAENAEPDHFPLFALTVDNLNKVVDHLQVNGVELPWGVEGHDGNRWVMFHDPAGNLIELAGP